MFFVTEALVLACFVAAGLVVTSYVVFEEDGFLDLTDFNVSHVLLLVCAALSVVFDNGVRAAWGAWVESDRAVFAYALFKTLSTITYFGLIWLVFFKHVMSPMLIDDFDDGYAFLSFADALSVYSILCLLLLVSLNAVGHAVAIAPLRSMALWAITTTVGAVVALMVFVNLFYGAPASSVTPRSLYALGVSSYTRSVFGVVGGYDWHSARSIPTAIFYVEYVSQLWLLLAALALVGLSVFGIVASLFTLVTGKDMSELRIVSGLLRASLAFGQLLGALLLSLLVVNFTHDIVLMTISSLSSE